MRRSRASALACVVTGLALASTSGWTTPAAAQDAALRSPSSTSVEAGGAAALATRDSIGPTASAEIAPSLRATPGTPVPQRQGARSLTSLPAPTERTVAGDRSNPYEPSPSPESMQTFRLVAVITLCIVALVLFLKAAW